MENTWVRSIEIVVRQRDTVCIGRVPSAQLIAGGLGDIGENICAYVPAAESVKAPVGFDG